MRFRISAISACLLIIFLSFNYGGVTPAARLVAGATGALIFIFVLSRAAASTRTPLAWKPLLLPPLLLILSAVLVRLAAPAPAVGRAEFWELISCSLLLAAIIISPPPGRALNYFYLFLLLWGVGLTLFGVVELGGNLLGRGELASTYINRNHFCAFLGLILPLTVSFGLGSPRRWLSWISRAGFLLLLAGVILTKSRGGLLAASISTMAVLIMWSLNKSVLGVSLRARRAKQSRLVIAAGLIIFLALIVVYAHYHSPSVYSTSLDALSIRTRISIWKSTVKMFLVRPWLGWGWGTFQYVYPLFKEPGVWYSVPHAHNEFLQLLSEGGVIGFIAVIFCLVWSLWRLVKNYLYSPAGLEGLFSLGAAGALVYIAVHSGFDFVLRIPANAYLLTALVGLGLSSSFPESAGINIVSRPGKLVFVLPVVLILGFFVLSPIGRFAASYLQWKEGEELLKAGDPSAARECFTRAGELDPAGNRPLFGRASANIELIKRSPDKIRFYHLILADLEEARRNNPWDLRPLWGLIRFHQGLSAAAETGIYLKEALAMVPTSPFLLYEMAGNELLQGRYKEAVLALRRAISIYPCMWDSSRKLLFSFTSSYDIWKELPPPESDYHRKLGYYLLIYKNWEAAENEFRQALALSPDNPENQRALGRLYFLLKNFKKSRRCYLKALSLSPDNAQWYSELGEVEERRGEGRKALDCYLKAYRLAPSQKSYPERAGRLILTTRCAPAALEFWKGVSARDPHWDRPHYHQARLYRKTGDIAAAAKEIELALRRAPKNRYYLNLKKQLDALSIRD